MITGFHGLAGNTSTSCVWACICILFFPSLLQAKSSSEPSYNYKLFCQGCHLPDGTGVLGEVPSLANNLSRYIKIPEGREFIVQVPGVMHALLTDAEVAELLNWLVKNFDYQFYVGGEFLPYSGKEVTNIRAKGYVDIVAKRKSVLKSSYDFEN
ncbi:MAG: cytochrome c [Halieaceae bacterium]|nr:cytochrome c [Halieaceae bacterium]